MTHRTDHGILLCGDVLEQLRTLPDDSVHCVVTSPPYWGLRDYGVDGQLGLEETPEEFIERMVAVFDEVRRVLHPSGTCWVNMGDTYSANNGSPTAKPGKKQQENAGSLTVKSRREPPRGLKRKELVGIPWRLALALQASGWWLRRDIIWHKPNPMPESCTDRPTTSHEYLFLLTKRAKYFYDAEAVREPSGSKTEQSPFALSFGRTVVEPDRPGQGATQHRPERSLSKHGVRAGVDTRGGNQGNGEISWPAGSRSLRSVWTIATHALPEAHFATFPPEIPRKCILAGTSLKGVCPTCGEPWRRVVKASGGSIGKSWHDHKDDGEQGQRASSAAKGGHGYKRTTTGWEQGCECETAAPIPATVLDPFFGAGTTGLVAEAHHRKWIGIELNSEYCAMAMKRIARGLDAPQKRKNVAAMPLLEESA